jgi:hypothetical protein
MYEWLFSDPFLKTMSAITGIPDLIGDPTLYGGGTHENLHGQALDPHVDFNFVSGGQAHRRVNLLIYLNKGWQSEWGGEIELHSNPRDPDTNEIKSFNVGFNRAVLFETNEYSWHGFPTIRLPEHERNHRSRKCISIYLYTRTRPIDEIAGSHSTFYVQRPLSGNITLGRVLDGQDMSEIGHAIRSRDHSIAAYQKREERLGRDIDGLQRYIRELLANVKLPTLGFALQTKHLGGTVWQDNFVSAFCSFEMRAVTQLREIELRGYLPPWKSHDAVTVTIDIDGEYTISAVAETGPFSIPVPVQIEAGRTFVMSITSSQSYNESKAGEGGDERDLAFLLGTVSFT